MLWKINYFVARFSTAINEKELKNLKRKMEESSKTVHVQLIDMG